jgi:hypothetical protein
VGDIAESMTDSNAARMRACCSGVMAEVIAKKILYSQGGRVG